MNAGRAVIVSDDVGCQRDLITDGVEGASSLPAMSRPLRTLCAELSRHRRPPSRWAVAASNGSIAGAFEEDIRGLRAGARRGNKKNRSLQLGVSVTASMRILHIIGTLIRRPAAPAESVRVLLSYGPIGYTGEVVTLDDPQHLSSRS